MKVLHLPVNVASIPSNTIKGLRKIGIDARGLVAQQAYCQSSNGLVVISNKPVKGVNKILEEIVFSYFFLKMLRWADIVHWYFGSSIMPWWLDIRLVKLLNKPALIEWLGSDIRIPEVELKDNPYYRTIFHSPEFPSKQLIKSWRKQKFFANHGFEVLVPPCMLQYLKKDTWNTIHVLRQRIMVSDYIPSYPEPDKKCPVIVHTPTKPVLKGTHSVLNAIERLKKNHCFEFRLIQNLSHADTLQAIRHSDIFLDQFVIGAHGMAALEAMAFGKPVVCYIKPSLVSIYPPDLPIINANQDNLVQILEKLITDGEKRNEIGKKSRNYVEKYHDAVNLAVELKRIYSTVIANKNGRY
ncbi:MAG: glycosyltransferase [Candidatus Omnitrophica bacterium]|nr:glycosyltransferase [Candidatus Omnitrophota bacterium]MCM8829076.1 glycosyltransferase [Candidatus Omnitrophota bacterium]